MLFLVVALSLGSAEFDHSAFQAILRETVRRERVDYLTIRRDHHRALAGYLDRLATADPAKWTRKQHLATLINLYNATVIQAVVERFRDGYSVAEGEFSLFDEERVRFAGELFSLNHLENERVRPVFQEPRVQVALVRGARSCPPLLARAYSGKNLREVLEDSMYRFVRNSSRNPIDSDARALRLSHVFERHVDDFGGVDGLVAYVDRYHPDDLSNLQPEFVDYDWSLNLLPPQSGEWIVITAETELELADGQTVRGSVGEVFELLEKAGGRWRVDRALGRGPAWIDAGCAQNWSAPES